MLASALLLASLNLIPSAGTANPSLTVNHAITILFPEHVTARKHGAATAVHLYLSVRDKKPATWVRDRDAFVYEMDLPGSIHMIARAFLGDDGILFRYEFTNRSNVSYDSITAVTDPRMQGVYHDAKLERTYVVRNGRFELLAEHRPVPIPSRYLASYTWPVPKRLAEKRDGVMYFNASRKIDAPFIATVSSDHKWVVASFTRTTGNVWSNPELTCQHVDPEVSLPAHGRAIFEVKLPVLRGTLQDAYRRMLDERPSMQ